MKNKIIKNVTIACVVLALICPMISTKIQAAQYAFTIEDYENIIEQVNAEYNQNLVITDMNAFVQNIYNKLTPNEFKQIIINKSAECGTNEFHIEIKPFSTKAMPNEIVTYRQPIIYGDWTSELSADIETQFFSNGSSKFVELIATGYSWSSVLNKWYFYPQTKNCTSFSGDSCTIKYTGYWIIPVSGVTDLATVTYNITYYPY